MQLNIPVKVTKKPIACGNTERLDATVSWKGLLLVPVVLRPGIVDTSLTSEMLISLTIEQSPPVKVGSAPSTSVSEVLFFVSLLRTKGSFPSLVRFKD